MRILLLVPKHYRNLEDLKTTPIWNETSLPLYQAHNFWYKALKSLGHDVHLFIYSGDNPTLDYYSMLLNTFSQKVSLGRRFCIPLARAILPIYERQRQILAFAHTFRPEVVVLSGNTDNVFPETLLELQKLTQTKMVLYNGLSPVMFATRLEKQLAGFFDLVCTNDFYHSIDWLMLGAKRAIPLPVSAIDTEVCRPYKLTQSDKRKFSCDIAFVGSLAPYALYRDRVATLEQLTDFNLKIWTYNKETVLSHPTLKRFYAGNASDIKMFKIFNASKINLNFHGHTMRTGGNMRTFEIPGSGGFELVDRVNPDWYHLGKEIVTFTDGADLKDKVSYYLTHDAERQLIAHAGYERTIRDHTYKNRFMKMLQLLSQ